MDVNLTGGYYDVYSNKDHNDGPKGKSGPTVSCVQLGMYTHA